MRYFVTGATGFVGSRLAARLRAAGHDVVALVRSPARARALSALGCELAEGDVTERESLRAPMAGVDGVFHVAGWYRVGVRDGAPGWRVNVDGTRNVLELMRELAVPKGVYTSTVAVFSDTHGRLVDERYRHDGPWLSHYDRTKWVAHYEVAEPLIRQGLPLVIVQPAVVYGPGDQSGIGGALRDYLRGRLPFAPARTAYCWGYVEDIAGGHLLAMERGLAGQSYILAGPPHTLAEAFEIAERLTGIPAPRIRVPPALLAGAARLAALVERYVALPGRYSAEGMRVVAGVTYYGDDAKSRRELGWEPRPLERGLRQTLDDEMEKLGVRPRRS